jgi:hypothetical protein
MTFEHLSPHRLTQHKRFALRAHPNPSLTLRTSFMLEPLGATGLHFVRVLKGRLYLVQFQLSITIHLSTTHSA